MFAEVALYDIDVAVKEIEKVTDNTKFSGLKISIRSSIQNAVHAIVDWYERAEKKQFLPEEDELLRAFMYVNNQLKHDKDLTVITYNLSGSMYPKFYPYRYGTPGVCWAEFKDTGRETTRKKRPLYEKMLMNKDVSYTLKRVMSIITTYNLDAKT